MGGAGYTYDANGNLKTDSYKGITNIAYNHLNLPNSITFSSGNRIEWVYDAAGMKLCKIVKQGATVQYEQTYAGGLEYRKNGTGSNRVEAIYHAEGRYLNLNAEVNNTLLWQKEYALRDHLGNTRMMFADKNANGIVETPGEIVQENHYYPFGLGYEGPWLMNDVVARDSRYQYNGKELDEDFGLRLYAYGARYYDPVTGRFTGVDPIGDQFAHVTTYNYAENEPVANIDLHGLQRLSIKEIAAYGIGLINAVGSNLIGGAGRGNPEDFGDAADYAAAGQTAGDIVSVVIGVVEVVGAVVGVVGEAVVAVPSGGVSTVAIAPTVALGVHGTVTVGSALNNLMGGNQVNMSSDKNKKNPKRADRERSAEEKKSNPEPASEKYAKYKAKELDKVKGKDAKRKAHDSKEKGAPDRSKKQLDEDYDRENH